MSQLSIKLNQQTKGITKPQDFSFLKEASPIYVTTFGNSTISADVHESHQSQTGAPIISCATSDLTHNFINKSVNDLCNNKLEQHTLIDNKENTLNILNTNNIQGTLLGDPHTWLENGDSNKNVELTSSGDNKDLYHFEPALSGGTEVLLGEQNLRHESRYNRRSGSAYSLTKGDSDKCLEKYLSENEKTSGSIYENERKFHDSYQSNEADMLNMLNQERGPHREMAVDVPESFIARNKTPPRYPPPQKPLQHDTLTQPRDKIERSNNNATNSECANTLERMNMHNVNNHKSHTISLSASNLAKVSITKSFPNESIIIPPLVNGEELPSYKFNDTYQEDFVLIDSGPHRELPVDVPDSFAEQKYQTRTTSLEMAILQSSKKRQSPPHSNDKLKEPLNTQYQTNENERSSDFQKSISNQTINHINTSNMIPQPQTPTRTSKEMNGPKPPLYAREQPADRIQIPQYIEPTPEQLDSIKKFQEQLRRRKEEEERIAQQNEFLRASLRGSRKLQALQDDPPPPLPERHQVGLENDAFMDDEDNDRIIGYSDLVNSLQRLQNHLNKYGLHTLAGKMVSAQNLLLGPAVARALATRTAVLQRRRPKIQNPITMNAQILAKDCVDSLTQSHSTSAIELCDILSTYEFEGLLQAHDQIAAITDRTPSVLKSMEPLPMKLLPNTILSKTAPNKIETPHVDYPRDNGEQDHIRIIKIEKSSEPLGATIRNEGDAVVIGRIVRGGAAEKSGLLHEGDEILQVNGTEMRGKSVNDVCALLGQMTGTLTFLVVPAGYPPLGSIMLGGGREPSVLHVRAHFDYDPEDDLYIPCRELGISFQKGDVLHVISRDDPNWWQAYREGEEDQTLAGLIPSQSFQHQRESMKLAIAGEANQRGRHKDNGNVKGATLLCARKGRKKKKKTGSEAGYPLYATTTTDEPETDEILTYEEVSLYYPKTSHKRPIVLIGPPNIGRHELRQRLMADSDRFAAAVPHTSRPRREGEVPGQDYHFISRPQFESDILARRFVEHGEYEKAYYGTSLEAIRTVVNGSKICVLNLHPQSLKLLRSSDLKPYVVLVAPPSLEKLRLKKIRSGDTFKEEELKEIIATARDMEARWGHLFDMIIINNETERAYHQLLTEINALEREPQWVPTQWIHS